MEASAAASVPPGLLGLRDRVGPVAGTTRAVSAAVVAVVATSAAVEVAPTVVGVAEVQVSRAAPAP